MCTPRVGLYVVDTTEHGGSCPWITDEYVGMVADDLYTLDQRCGGTYEISADNCQVTLDETCPTDSVPNHGLPASQMPIGYFEEKGTIRWSVNASYGSGLIELSYTLPATGYSCSATFERTYTRD